MDWETRKTFIATRIEKEFEKYSKTFEAKSFAAVTMIKIVSIIEDEIEDQRRAVARDVMDRVMGSVEHSESVIARIVKDYGLDTDPIETSPTAS